MHADFCGRAKENIIEVIKEVAQIQNRYLKLQVSVGLIS